MSLEKNSILYYFTRAVINVTSKIIFVASKQTYPALPDTTLVLILPFRKRFFSFFLHFTELITN
jgi:hypothetical protein